MHNYHINYKMNKIRRLWRDFRSKFRPYKNSGALNWMGIWWSPFIPPRPVLWIGRIKVGTPIFYPRRWVKKQGILWPQPKWIGFDFVGLGWKTKWELTDYRFEWDPVWSFVFWRWQVAVTFTTPYPDQLWPIWLYWNRDTNPQLSTVERLKECMEKFPCVWMVGGEREEVNYYRLVVKPEYLRELGITPLPHNSMY